MKKFFLAVLILSVVFNSLPALATEWTSYFQIGWDEITNSVTDLFTSDKDENKEENNKTEEKTPAASIKNESPQQSENLPPKITSDWGNLTENLTEALKLRDKNESLPESSWNPFKEDKESNTKKINKLLDAAMKILVGSEAGDLRKEAGLLRESIAKKRVELDEMRNKKINAPESSYAFWTVTREKAEKKISELENEIKNGEVRLNNITAELTRELEKQGLELDETETEILLNSVTGDDLLRNAIIFSNVKSVVAKLETLSQNETNSFEITKRYTGMYLVLNDLLILTQDEFIKKIDGEYKPKLNLIIGEAEALRKTALSKSNNKNYTPDQRKSFAANTKSNEMTIKVAKLYGDLLNSQRASTLESLKSLNLNRDLAENTYRTVRSSGELKNLIHSGLNLFDSIDGLKMPELKIFENDTMRLEFEEIDRRLRKSN
ncbi:MAG: hypothetical protein IJ597_06170 [Synergistaceae bacterium]|nr:hypothetical protein [Synergistaceae bacterium]